MATSDIRYDAPMAASPNLNDLPPDIAGLAFPGCTARLITREEIGCYEGRLEFWDGQIATAWVAEPTTPAHEAPCAALAQLAERIAAVRGAPIACYGNMALMVRDDDGQPRRIMQADQSLYVHSGEIDLRGAPDTPPVYRTALAVGIATPACRRDRGRSAARRCRGAGSPRLLSAKRA